MTLPAWPAELLAPMQDGFSRAMGEGRSLTRPDTGPMRARRRFSAVAKPVSVSIIMSRDELALFDNFYADDLAEGSLPFLMPDPMTDGWALLTDDGTPLLTEAGTPILLAETWLVIFGEQLPVTVPFAALDWKVSFGLAVLP